ncbi:hypothetical protein EDD86DRAFT_208393, partial [Gorgonomyces haynaldii]
MSSNVIQRVLIVAGIAGIATALLWPRTKKTDDDDWVMVEKKMYEVKPVYETVAVPSQVGNMYVAPLVNGETDFKTIPVPASLENESRISLEKSPPSQQETHTAKKEIQQLKSATPIAKKEIQQSENKSQSHPKDIKKETKNYVKETSNLKQALPKVDLNIILMSEDSNRFYLDAHGHLQM